MAHTCPTCGHPIEHTDQIVLHPDLNTVTYHGEAVRLMPQQFKIFRVLRENLGELVSREQLYSLLWGDRPPADRDGVLKVQVCNMRKSLAAWPFTVGSVWGRGYVLTARAS